MILKKTGTWYHPSLILSSKLKYLNSFHVTNLFLYQMKTSDNILLYPLKTGGIEVDFDQWHEMG